MRKVAVNENWAPPLLCGGNQAGVVKVGDSSGVQTLQSYENPTGGESSVQTLAPCIKQETTI